MRKSTLIIILLVIATYSCVSPKKFQSETSNRQREIAVLRSEISSLEHELNTLNNKTARLQKEINSMEYQIQSLRRENSEKVLLFQQQINEFEVRDRNLRKLITTLRLEVATLKQN